MYHIIKMNSNPELTIGIPVFNGEEFLNKKITSILQLGYENFELIISDNASTDKTKEISQSFLKDKRIKYFYHEKNMGPVKNFEFILKKATGKYFMWTAVDDLILPTHIEKNVEVLKNQKIVCSASQVKYYGEKTEKFKQNKKKSLNKKIANKIVQHLSPLENIPVSEKLDSKIRKYLSIRGHHHIFYGIYRTEQIKKIFVANDFSGFDWATILNSLNFGDIHVVNDILMYRYDGGYSSKGFFNYKKSLGLSFFQTLFHYFPFTKWFIGNFGKKKFLKNLDLFILLNLEGFFYLGVDLVRKSSIFKNK